MFQQQSLYHIVQKGNLLHINHCDKEGTAVLKRIASINGNSASTLLLGDHHKPPITNNYLHQCSTKLTSLYTMPKSKTIVFGSCHQASPYIAELLDAPFLPLQFMGFCKSLQEIKSLKCTKIIGCDYDFRNFCWVWCKITDTSQIPESYQNIIREAQNCVIVRSTEKFRRSGKSDKCLGRLDKDTFVHSSIKLWKKKPQDLQQQLHEADQESERLRQWEFGLPDSSIIALRAYWNQLHPNKTDNFIVIESETVKLYKFIPYLFQKYYEIIGHSVRGISLNPYYTLHPYYEKKARLIPFVFYNFHVLQEYFQQVLNDVKKSKQFKVTPSTVICWSNRIEGEKDLGYIKEFWKANSLLKGWFSVGLDCIGKHKQIQCKDVYGSSIPLPHEKVNEWLSTTDQLQARAMQFAQLKEYFRFWVQMNN